MLRPTPEVNSNQHPPPQKEKSVLSKVKSGPKSPKTPPPAMVGPDGSNIGRWTDLEHAQFLEGLKKVRHYEERSNELGLRYL